MTSSGAYDVAVVGAGIVGSACAWAMAASGLRVAVVDMAVVGGGATAAGMGHVVVMDDSAAQFALTSMSRRLWDELAERMPPMVDRLACGTLWVAADDEELAAAQLKHEYYSGQGVKTELLSPARVAELEPNLRPGLAGGLLVTQDSVVYPPAAAEWMLSMARQAGAQVTLGRRVTAIDDGLTLDDGMRIAAHSVVLAAGHLAKQLVRDVPLRPKKGHLVITDRHPGFCRHQIIELGYLKSAHGDTAESVAFNVQPRGTGQVLIGSSRQFDVTDPTIDLRMLSRMLARAAEYMPGIARLKAIRAWAGFRAATPDGLPIIGPHYSRENLWLALGHEGLGITTSLGTAALLTDMLWQRSPAIDPSPYLPSRFPQPKAASHA